MRFHGMMLVRDEEDVIAQCLDHLLTWIDTLHIYDLGSTDSTWEIIQDFARRDKRIVPVVRQPTVYTDNLRCYLFHRAREKFDAGDWCMKIDADEFYHVPPPQFARERLGPLDSAVHLQWYFFRMTTAEARAYETGEVDTEQDRKRSITDRRRFYKISTYAEPRMFKYRRTHRWPETISFPYNAGYVARERMPIRHYPHRDPAQLQRRYRLRASMMKLNAEAGGHWKLSDWRQDLVDEKGFSASQKTGAGLADNAGVDTDGLLYWEPGTELVERPDYSHVQDRKKRLLQRVIHPLLVPLLDSRRPHYSPAWHPVHIDEETNERIGREGLSGAPEQTPLAAPGGTR